MFRNRTSSQKPGDELYEDFHKYFPAINGTATSSGSSNTGGVGLSDVAVDVASQKRQQPLEHEDIKDKDLTLRAQHELWMFTPSLPDPNSFAFANFANQPPGYYTPTPGGTNTLYHGQAGDLHTPGTGIGRGPSSATPLSMPSSDNGVCPRPVIHAIQPYQYHNYDPFSNSPQQQERQDHETLHLPSTLDQDTGYETMEYDGSPVDNDVWIGPMDTKLQYQSALMSYEPRQYESNMTIQVPSMVEKFRFHVILNAQTAMIKYADEIPVTYLNKGQAYSISIVDTTPTLPIPAGSRYRTFLRISFEDEQQRQRPANCWQLWKEGRGTNEAHRRGGKLQAIEYVEASQPAENEENRIRVELETASFDGFSVTWAPGVNGLAQCNIAVRFNFLSTDFSYSKGVKGIPVRLCAKTQSLTAVSPHSALGKAEVVFCKVKLFRDHGAERKLSNDVVYLKKTIDNLKQQIAQVEAGIKDFGKRKRSSSITTKVQPSQKRKQTWSLLLTSSASGGVPVEEDLYFKLQTIQGMYASTRLVSTLHLRGEEQDDPDLYPVATLDELLGLTEEGSRESINCQPRRSSCTSFATGALSLVSISPSSIMLRSQSLTSSSILAPATQEIVGNKVGNTDVQEPNLQQLPLEQLIRTPKTDYSKSLSGRNKALGEDSSYRPLVEHPVKPVACFYVLHRDPANPEKHEYYRAIYLEHRTLKNFTNAVAVEWKIEPTEIRRTLHVLQKGLEVEVDDDVIRELSEGQDILLEILKIDISQVRREWDMAVDVAVESDAGTTQNVVHADGYVLKIIF